MIRLLLTTKEKDILNKFEDILNKFNFFIFKKVRLTKTII